VARRAGHVIAISDAVNHYVQDRLALTEGSITTIHYGVDTAPYRDVSVDAVAKLRTEWGGGGDCWLIGTVARLVPQKAVHSLIEAYARYRRHASKASRLIIVGQGPLEAALKALADNLGIASEVTWAGFREDIPVVMRALDLFVLTSIYEGFGLVLLEAMAAARPVLATSVSATPEVVADGRTGVLVPPLDTVRLADAVSFFEQQVTREAFGQAGYERATRDFTLDRMVQHTLEIYDRCLK
jgi:glycosyltransferase involved in cell wall biosynthesis